MKCIGISTDGAQSMSAPISGLCAHFALSCLESLLLTSFIEALVSSQFLENLRYILNESVAITKNLEALYSRIFLATF